MGQRSELHILLKTLCPNVYFQPPSGTTMSYPCIKYERSKIHVRSGDNISYLQVKQYTITVIDANPDSEIVDKVSKLPRCVYDRPYKADNLNHDVFTILF